MVAAHAEALVADPVALREVLAAARAGEGDRAHHQREAELGRDVPEVGHGVGQRLPGAAADDRERRATITNSADHRDLDEDQPLERDVDDRRQRQRRADDARSMPMAMTVGLPPNR